MGTAYKLYEDSFFGDLTISEMSNKLSFCIEIVNTADIATSVDMEPEEMAKILLEGLTVCSYWMDVDELKEMIRQHVEKNIF